MQRYQLALEEDMQRCLEAIIQYMQYCRWRGFGTPTHTAYDFCNDNNGLHVVYN